jgi:thymidylate synthase (FAD)
VRIAAIAYAGEQMTYDIIMEGPHHNFVANGIVTHNSQLSQRYVSGRMLRFVERPEYAEDEQLHAQFLERIERASNEYTALSTRLLEMQQAGAKILSAEARTDLRKKVQQCARSVLPNETEAPIVVTANARAWRHFIEMRASAHAEIEIRELAVRVFLCLHLTDPILFGDYTLEQLPDGTYTAKTEFEKV